MRFFKTLLLLILVAFVLGFGFSPLSVQVGAKSVMFLAAEEMPIIGEFSMPDGLPAYVSYVKPNEYLFTAPFHGIQVKASVSHEGDTFVVTMEDGHKFKADPPFEQWTWTQPGGTSMVLDPDTIGATLSDIIRRHAIGVVSLLK